MYVVVNCLKIYYLGHQASICLSSITRAQSNTNLNDLIGNIAESWPSYKTSVTKLTLIFDVKKSFSR